MELAKYPVKTASMKALQQAHAEWPQLLLSINKRSMPPTGKNTPLKLVIITSKLRDIQRGSTSDRPTD